MFKQNETGFELIKQIFVSYVSKGEKMREMV